MKMAVDIKGSLEHKIGPLPMWAWGGIVIIGWIVFTAYSKKSGSNTVAQPTQVLDSNVPPPWWYNQPPGSPPVNVGKPPPVNIGKPIVGKPPMPKPKPTPTPIHHPPVKGKGGRKPEHVPHRINTTHKSQGYRPTPVHVINKSGGHVATKKPVSRARITAPLQAQHRAGQTGQGRDLRPVAKPVAKPIDVQHQAGQTGQGRDRYYGQPTPWYEGG